MNRNDIYCPITQTNNVNVISKIDTKYIIEKWQNQYSIDVSSEFTGVENIYYCHSTVADFYFFYPIVTGSSKFYQILQEKFNWYYSNEKWEFDKVLSLLNKGDHIFELGCGSGNFLFKCNLNGYISKGIEYNKVAVDSAKGKGLDVELIDLKEFVDKKANVNQYDVVCSFQVLEHVKDPISILINSMLLLRTGGKLIVSVPNRISFLKHKFILFDHPPHHTCRWDVNSLSNLKNIIGAKSISIYYEPLSYDHIWEFVGAYKIKFGKLFFFKIIPKKFKKYLEKYFIDFLVGGGRKLFRGHTIIAVYQK
jgi:2-polyprenyl-3-methyl-5-hydroxy-6-metoxy-1,4-benzoquinol methylase